MRMRRPIIVGAFVLTAVAGWFLCVDWSWFRDECPDCGYNQCVGQYRLLGIPVHERRLPWETAVQRTASALGVPCQHPELSRWHKHRWWGLCYCAAPCINGLFDIRDDHSEFDELAARRAPGLLEKNPNLGREFHQRVLRDHDWNYWREVAKQIHATDTSDSDSNDESDRPADPSKDE